MKANLLTSIARTVASTLLPSRINVEKDSLAKAISRKSGNDSISLKTENKLLVISNYSALPKTAYDKNPESCTHKISVIEMKKQLQDVSRASGGSRHKSRAVGNRISKVVNSIEKRVGFAEDLWTRSYWKSRDGATADLQSQASTAVQRLGCKPEWKDYCLTQQVSKMAQELTIPAQAICRMEDAFHGIYRIPHKDAANSTLLTYTDFADPSHLPDFVDLSFAAKDLRDAHALLPSFHDDGVRDGIERTLKDFTRILESAFEALLNRHQELAAMPDVSAGELNAIGKWLGIPETPDEASIDNDVPYGNMTITEAFNAAAETQDLTDSQLKVLEDRIVAMLALPKRSASQDAPYVPDDFLLPSQAAEGTRLFSAQSELTNVANALAANPDNPSSAQLRPLISDLRARTGETVMYWLEKHAILEGDASNLPSPPDVAELEQIALYLGMADLNVPAGDSSLDDFAPPDDKSQAGHLFVQPGPDQYQAKRRIFTSDTHARGFARMIAMR